MVLSEMCEKGDNMKLIDQLRDVIKEKGDDIHLEDILPLAKGKNL